MLKTGKDVCGKGKERRTANVEGKGGDSMGKEGCWRRMERSEAFQPLTSSGTCPNLGLVFQWLVLLPWLWEKEPVYRKQAGCASHSLAGLGWRQKLTLFAAEKAPASRGV